MNNYADILIRFFRESQRVVLGLVDSFDQSFLGVVTRLAPVLAPIPAAYSVYRAMVTVGAPERIALVTATAIELIGMFQSKTALRARNWNLVKLKSDPAAPFGLALTMAAIYFLTAFGLTVAIEFLPDKAHLVFPAFVVFAASVYVSNALASDLTRWETDRDDRLRGQQERSGLVYEVKKLTMQANQVRLEVKSLTDKLANRDNDLAALTGQIDQAKLTLAALTGQIDQARSTMAAQGNDSPGILTGQNGHFDWPETLKAANRAKQDEVIGRRAKLVDLLTTTNLTNEQLADQLGVSVSTIKGDKKALNGQLAGRVKA